MGIYGDQAALRGFRRNAVGSFARRIFRASRLKVCVRFPSL